jgi:peptidoglycan hydrolase-like protein with peptidoglycan-binding domain
VAAYGQPEPAVRHKLWQFTDNFQVPGVGRADCSIFHGTIDQLAALAWPARTATWTETLMQNLPTLGQGDTDLAGQVQYVHRIQALTRLIGDINKLPAASAVRASGKFDQTTAAGVKVVQKFFGLTSDGICGPKTWAALVAGEHG